MDVYERYERDATFHQAVDVMSGMIQSGMLTSHDIARAAVLAAELHARRNMAPIVVILKEGGE